MNAIIGIVAFVIITIMFLVMYNMMQPMPPSAAPIFIPNATPVAFPATTPATAPTVTPVSTPILVPVSAPVVVPVPATPMPTVTPTITPVVSTSGGTPKYVGCYVDKPDPNRRFKKMASSSYNLTQCAAAAKAANTAIFGMQFGSNSTGLGECWIGDAGTTLDFVEQYGTTGAICNPIANSAGNYMGTAWSNAVYTL